MADGFVFWVSGQRPPAYGCIIAKKQKAKDSRAVAPHTFAGSTIWAWALMSALGHNRTLTTTLAMSALPPKADIRKLRRSRDLFVARKNRQDDAEI
jgi:hypothetical protein